VTDATKAILMIFSDGGNSPEESSVVEVKPNEIDSLWTQCVLLLLPNNSKRVVCT